MSKPPKAYRFVRDLPQTLRNMRQDIQNVRTEFKQKDTEIYGKIDELSEMLETLQQKQSDIANSISSIKWTAGSTKKIESNLQADNHALDGYYLAFETKFRGSEADIYSRLRKSYSSVLTGLPKHIKDLPIIDIGCGRGELLKLFKELGFSKTLGIDLNGAMIARCKELGYDVLETNGLAYLSKAQSKSLGGISGIHLIEHIPFEALMELANESFRTLAPGGFVLFETPNSENLTVGSHTFWYDSSHIKPIPPDLMAFILEYVGFDRVEILRFHPGAKNPDAKSVFLKQVSSKLFGPRDYAVVGFKASAKK